MAKPSEPTRSETTPLFTWYHNLKLFKNLEEAFEDFNPDQAPEDWTLFITDVVGSTAAIESGRYKEVNTAGSLPTMALANFFGSMHFPFIFGGDGMTALLPSGVVGEVSQILLKTKAMVKELFELELRIGAVSVSELTKRQSELRVARVKISPTYIQALLWGNGLDLAEKMVKGRDEDAKRRSPGEKNPWQITAEVIDGQQPDLSGDFSGFSCRWQPIKSHLGKTVSLLIQGVGTEPEKILKQSLHDIRSLIGSDESRHPVSIENQKLVHSEKYIAVEAEVENYQSVTKASKWRLFSARFSCRLKIWLAQLIIFFQIPFLSYAGSEVRKRRELNRINSDVQKVDGMLKMVFSCTEAQLLTIKKWLEEKKAEGKILYGYHISTHALMTCFVHDGSGNEVHFVDADHGGYALAAKMLKSQSPS
jgi:hypothetical protein